MLHSRSADTAVSCAGDKALSERRLHSQGLLRGSICCGSERAACWDPRQRQHWRGHLPVRRGGGAGGGHPHEEEHVHDIQALHGLRHKVLRGALPGASHCGAHRSILSVRPAGCAALPTCDDVKWAVFPRAVQFQPVVRLSGRVTSFLRGSCGQRH